MKIKLSKKLFAHYLEYNFIFLIASLIISYAFFYFSLHTIHAYKEEEKINFFIEGQSINDASLEKDLLDNITGLYEVNYRIAPTESDTLITLYEAYFATSDIYVLRQQDFIDMKSALVNTFMVIDESLISDIGIDESTYEMYSYENQNYAIKIYDKDDNDYNVKSGFTNFINFDQDLDNYYLALSKSSIKFGEHSKTSTTDIGIKTLSYMFKRYNNV